jgi:hypothetical protein
MSQSKASHLSLISIRVVLLRCTATAASEQMEVVSSVSAYVFLASI